MKNNFINIYYLLSIAWAFCILFATLSSSASLSGFNLLDIFQYDKPIHATLFGVQAWLLIKARTKSSHKNFLQIVLFSCLISTGYGVLTEILQGIFVLLGRSFDVMDMFADAIGCAVVYFWFRFKNKPFAQ
ncbi:MAG: VanZ family protein [Bacteroidota bacterium]